MGDEVNRANQATVLIKSTVKNDKIRKFISGGIAGCIAKGIISPFDRIKILRQGEHKVHGNLSILRSAKTIVQTEGMIFFRKFSIFLKKFSILTKISIFDQNFHF